jgi:SAM-dependent MidA family methyltransferase
MDGQPGLRRIPGPDLDAVGEDVALANRIRDEIRRDGPMSFARFMHLALYDPEGGYYRSAEARPGRRGDFLTAPELHPIFGQTLATGLEDVWRRLGRPGPFVIREHGAGEGALADAILSGIADPAFRAAVRYEPVEVDERRIDAFRTRLAEAGYGDALARPEELAARATAHAAGFTGVVLANEVLDALPVHRVRQRGAELREVAVGLADDGAFVDVEIAPTTRAIAERFAGEGIRLRDGQAAEVGLAADAWVADAARSLARGLLLLIDYGAPARALYDPVRRRVGTLRAYLRHRVHDDVLAHVGRQDLTAHVDVTTIERAAHAAGLSTVGLTTQAEALMGLGIEDRLRAIQADPATTMGSYTLVRAALLRLLDPSAMGRFQVMGFGRDWPAGQAAPLRLFAYRLPAPRPSAD